MSNRLKILLTTKRLFIQNVRCMSSGVLPDYNTPVDTKSHRLQRPTAEKIRSAENLRESLIPDTLKQMENDEDFQITLEKLKKFGQAKLTKEETIARRRALDFLGIPDFKSFCIDQMGHKGKINKHPTEILQVNIGLYCNQACNHCHVESSPKRTEMMSHDVAEKCLILLESSPQTHTLDITGGAPELCAEFRFLAESASKMGRRVIDRCNLTSLLEPGQEDTAEFLAKNNIEVVASLPCYSRKNVNLQRGGGVFQRSIEALKLLNSIGYGRKDSGLVLDLVYNPLGGFLPPKQSDLEAKYKLELDQDFGITFNNLYTITNMPIKRFCDFLVRRGELTDYMNLLVRNFNPDTLDNIMCRNLVNVGYDGSVYDCDFNQQLDLPINADKKRHVFDIKHLDELTSLEVNTSNHCFGCTSGMGSS